MPNADFQSFVDEVVERNDICEVISEYAKLKRMGNRFAALCPLHNDKKSPSLSISPDKQVFYCFGCGAGGNVIHFIMAAEHLDFMDAVKLLAERVRMEMPSFGKNAGGTLGSAADKKQLIYSINREAGKYFYKNLASDTGGEAYSYLKGRGIKNSTIKKFGIGYAPEGWTRLIDYLKTKGFSEHEIYEAGLAKIRDNGTYYDSFYDGRIMIPIIDVRGNIIGFGGRIIVPADNTGKYLNTPETAVFHKKENLFGLNLAKNNRSGSLLLMEGYMDVISLHQAGITNAVASLGTAFTDEQAKLVKRYGGKAVLCYDSDEAGKKATVRAGGILTEHEIKTKVLTVKGGKDPDEYVQKYGGDMFKVLIEQAKPLIEYRIDEILKQFKIVTVDENGKETSIFPSTEAKIEFTEAAANLLSELKNPMEYEIYVKRIAAEAEVSPASINASVSNLKMIRNRTEERREERRIRRNAVHNAAVIDNPALYNAEELLLNLMCDKDVYRLAINESVSYEDFTDSLHMRLAKTIYDMYETDGNVDINRILVSFRDEERGRVSKILLEDKNTSDKKSAAKRPLEIINENKNLRLQEELMDSDKLDLAQLDALLRKKRAH